MRYIRIWEAAAKKALVPSASLLTPGNAESTRSPDEITWKQATVLAKEEAASAKPAALKAMLTPVTITEERGHQMEAAKKDVQHIADAALNLPEFSDADRDQVLKFVEEMATVLAKIKKTALATKTTAPKKTA